MDLKAFTSAVHTTTWVNFSEKKINFLKPKLIFRKLPPFGRTL
jgi:hypothetical protein